MFREVICRGSRGDTVETLQERLVELDLLEADGVDGDFGRFTEAAVLSFQRSHGLAVDGIVGSQTWGKLFPAKQATLDVNPLVPASGTLVQRSQLEQIFQRTVPDDYVTKLNKALVMFEINTSNRIRHFLAQIGHESGGLRWFAEIADGSAYEGREDLGNTEPGDGRRFKGVDPLQITGRYNYLRLSKYLDDPRVMEGWEYVMANCAFIPSGFWWHDNNMNAFIDSGATVEQVSTRVNGANPANGLSDRIAYFERALYAIPGTIVLQPEAIAVQPAATPATAPKWTLSNIVQTASIIPNGSFTWAEATRSGSRMPPNQEILDNMVRIAKEIQKARDMVGKPFHVTSWYRTPEANAAAGGVPNSRHLVGDAIDFYVDGMMGREIFNLLDPWWEGGLGRYDNYPYMIHVDARDERVRWEH